MLCAELAATSESPVESQHPQCRVLNGTQLVLGLLSLAGGIWKGRLWWLSTVTLGRKKFSSSCENLGKPKGMLGVVEAWICYCSSSVLRSRRSM